MFTTIPCCYRDSACRSVGVGGRRLASATCSGGASCASRSAMRRSWESQVGSGPPTRSIRPWSAGRSSWCSPSSTWKSAVSPTVCRCRNHRRLWERHSSSSECTTGRSGQIRHGVSSTRTCRRKPFADKRNSAFPTPREPAWAEVGSDRPNASRDFPLESVYLARLGSPWWFWRGGTAASNLRAVLRDAQPATPSTGLPRCSQSSHQPWNPTTDKS